ncbi:MAG: dicarboxylate/amino acid:cation symporter, partial [Vicinamibacterales bacterium]
VSLLITGVASSASVRAVRGIGVRAIVSFVGLLLFAAVVSLLVVPPLFGWLHIDPATAPLLQPSATDAGSSATARVPSFAEWVTGIVPSNPIQAAADGAVLPLVMFALPLALALLTLAPERRGPVVAFFAGLGDAMLAIVRVVIALSPIGVFALMLPLATRTGGSVAGALGYYVVVMSVTQLLMIALLYPVAAVVGGVTVSRFARAVFPAQAVAFSSSSSLASLPALIDGANRRLGLPPRVSDVVLPLAVSTFKMGLPLMWITAAAFLGRFYGVTLTPMQLVLVALTAIMTSFSTPGVPHGWLLVISPLVATMGIPPQGIGLLIAVDAIPDMFATTLNVTGDMAAAAIVSRNQEAPRGHDEEVGGERAEITKAVG